MKPLQGLPLSGRVFSENEWGQEEGWSREGVGGEDEDGGEAAIWI